MSNIGDYLTLLGPSTIIAIGAIIAAWMQAKSNKQESDLNEGLGFMDSVNRVAPLLAAGFSLTAVVMLFMLGNSDIRARDQLFEIENTTVPHTLADFAESITDVSNETKALGEDAKSILEGAGPKEWQTVERLWKVGDVVFVKDSEWVDEVFPGKEQEDDSESCILEPRGRLTVKGFSQKRRSALIEYTAPGPSGGTPCDTGSYFFYKLAPRT